MSSQSLSADSANSMILVRAMMSAQTKALFDIGQTHCSPLYNIHQPLHHTLQKGAFLSFRFIVLQRLHHGNTPASAGEEHRAMGRVNLADNPAWIDFQVTQ